jgi:hypothetical protein
MTKQLTVREIAKLIQRPHEDIGTVVDRIRGWSDDGLVSVIGNKSPGTGRQRLYGPEAILDCLLLTALVDAGLAAVRVGKLRAHGKTLIGFGRLGAADVFDAEIHDEIYLVIPGTPDRSHPSIYLARSKPWEEAGPDGIRKRVPNRVTLVDDAPWSIILNLRRVFSPVRHLLLVENVGGFVKVRFVDDVRAQQQFHLVVTEPFETYTKGARIDDNTEIERVLAVAPANSVVKVKPLAS